MSVSVWTGAQWWTVVSDGEDEDKDDERERGRGDGDDEGEDSVENWGEVWYVDVDDDDDDGEDVQERDGAKTEHSRC